MSEYDDIEDKRHHESAPEARVKVARWSPWIWVIPVLAIFFVGYLIVRYGFGGGDVTVRFVEARGLDRYSPVRFRGAKVGTVQKITVDDDLNEVVVRITMDASMNHALKKGTKFWIVEPGLEGGGIGGILSGTFVAVAPGEGEETREFVGQEWAPIMSPPTEGKTVILEAQGAGSVSMGSPVQFQGMRVGHVLGSEYDEQRRITSIHVFIVKRFANNVRQSTRWWRGSGFGLSLSGGGVSMKGASLSSLLSSPIAFYTPEVMAGPPVASGTRYQLHDSEGAAVASADGPHLNYLTYFPGSIGGLTPGTPVQMKGVQVGRVREVRLRYLPATASLETPVMIEIDPRKMEFAVTDSTSRADLRNRMNDALSRMVRKGMRATLATSLVLPGASAVSLEFVAPAGTGQMILGSDPPIIPATTKNSGIDAALASVGDIADTIKALPLREIASNVQSASERINALVSDPRLNQSLERLNSSMADIQKIASTTRENVGPLVESLRNAATSAEAAARSAEGLIGSSQRQNYDLAELVKELTRAAEAVRALATYLSEHPDSLLKGRPK
jgi:paraquat-inducible protein B